nr:LOW QUALITY PROTEIN: coiled-coil domain-containing protein 168 [Equus asinus]
MLKQFYFFKKALQGGLGDSTFLTLWDLLESWISQNVWIAIFFIISLGIIFEMVLIKICTSFQKKPALPEKSNSDAQEKEHSCLKSMKFDNWSIHSSSEERIDDFSEGTSTSLLTSEENEGYFKDRVLSADEITWAGSSEGKYQVSHFSESHMLSSNETNPSLSLLHSEAKEISLSHRGYPENEREAIQSSSKKLFSMMKTNKTKNLMFSSDFNFSRTSRITMESEDLDVASCPSAHLFLSRDQVRLLEENVRNQIPLKSKAVLESETTYLYSRSQESLIRNQRSFRMDISAQTQVSFPGQNAIQNQGFYEAQFTSQAQRFVNNQESVNCQSDIKARYFSMPQDLTKKPFSSNTQCSFQTQDMDGSQHLVKVPHSVQSQDSSRGLESDKKQLDEAQYSVWFEDSNKIKYSILGQRTIFKNARSLVLTVSPKSVAEEMPQLKSVKLKGQKQIPSSKLNQYSVYGSVPLSPTTKRQKNRRKTLHGKSKFSLKVSSQKSKKTPTSQVFQITVCHTSKESKLGGKYNTKKKELDQRKGVSDRALHLIYVSKLVPPYMKKYCRKKLMKVMPGLTGCRYFLLKQNISVDAEKGSCAESVGKSGTSGKTEKVKQHGGDNKGLKNMSLKIPPQLKQPFMVNNCQLKAPFLLIEANWKNKKSFKDPITQANEVGIAEFHAPNRKKTSDLPFPKYEMPLEEDISQPLQKLVFSPKLESNRRMKTQEDLKSTENSHLPLSNGEKLPTSSPEMQRCLPQGNTQEQEDFLEIVLESSDVNLLISLGTKKRKSSEQLASVKTQESTEDVILKAKKPSILDVTEYDNLSESEELECNSRSNIKNMQDKRIADAFHNATNTTISQPPDMEMLSRLKAKTDTSRIELSHSVVKQEKLPEEKKIWNVKYIEKKCVFKKPQEHDREEEEQALQEEVPQLPQDFRFSLQLKQKSKHVKFEIEQSSSGSRKTQNRKQEEVKPQTLSTETILGTNPCPTMDPFEVENVKQSTNRPTDRETAEPKNLATVPENLPVGEVLIETTECGVPFGRSSRKTLDDRIAEEKEDLKKVLPAVSLGSFIIHMLPLSYFKRQKIRKKLSGTKSILSPKCVIMKAKKPAILLMPDISRHGSLNHRQRLRGNFKIISKKMLRDNIEEDVLLNVIYPHVYILPHIRTHSRLNAENHSYTKLKQEKSQVEREEKCSDSINKGSDSGNTLEGAKLQDEVRGDKEAPQEAVLPDSWNLRLDAYPEKKLKTEKEMHQPPTSAETTLESMYSPIIDPPHIENMKSLTTQPELKCTADSEMPLPTSEKSLIGDPLNQTRESDVPDYRSNTREMGYCFAEAKVELPEDLPSTFPETFNCHMPVLTHSKVKKNGVRFSHTECTVRPKSVHMKAVKPSISQTFNITGHRKKLESNFKAKFEKINQANGLLFEFLNTLYSPMHNRLQGETDSFCHTMLKQGELADEGRPQYVDFFGKNGAFHDREEKVQDEEEMEQKTLLEAASHHTQYLWPDVCQGKETYLDEPDLALDCLTQELPVNEQDVQHQTYFTQTALQTGLQMLPREAEQLQKTNRTENDITAPMGPKILLPKAGNSSVDKLLNTTERGLPSGRNHERERNSFVEENSELPKDLQVTFLQSSDSVELFVSKSKRKKKSLKLARKRITVSRRHRTMREEKPSISHMLNGRQSKELQCNFKAKMKNPQQNKNVTDALLDIIHFNMLILPIKMNSRLNVETDRQKIISLGQMQLMQEKSPNGRKLCSPGSIDMSGLPNGVKDGKAVEGEHEALPVPENNQGFVFNAYQKKNYELVKSDEELKQPGSKNIQVQPQIHFTQTILGSASCPILDQFQFGKLESYARYSRPKSKEGKTDKIIFSARECGVPSGANHQKEQAGGIEKKETVTSDFCLPTLSTSKSKRNFKQYSDMKTLVNLKCGISKAKKPSISCILNIKGGANPNHRKELGCNLTTKMNKVDQGKKMADSMYSFMTFTPDINMYSKAEREKDILEEKRLSSKQVKQAVSPQGGNITLDDTKETNNQDKEEEESEQEMLLKVILQHSQHFVFFSGQREKLDLQKSENQGSRKILFVIEQDVPQQMQPTDPMQVKTAKKSLQTQNGTTCSVNSQLPLLESKTSLIGQALIDTMRHGVPSNGSHTGEWYSCSKEEKAECKNDPQANALESLHVSTPDLPESKRQRKTFTCRTIKSKMSPKCVIMKAQKAPISQIFNISGNGCLKNLPPKTLKSQIIDFLIYIKFSGVLDDLTVERKEGLAQKLPAMILESLDLSTLALPVSKRRRDNLKLMGKRNKMNLKCVALKAKKAPISQTFNIMKCGTSSHRRQSECNCKTVMKQGKPVSDIILKAISSPMPVSLDMEIHNRTQAETNMLWKTRLSHEQQQQEQSSGGERAWCACSRDKRGSASNGIKKVKAPGREAALQNSRHFSLNAHKRKMSRFVKSDLELKNSVRKNIPESLTITQELQQQILFIQSVLHSVSCCLLNSFPFEKLPKRTKTQKGLKHTRRSVILSPLPGKSVSESLIVTARSDIPSEKGSRKELAGSILKGKMKLQKALQARSLESFDFSMPASSELKGQRNAAQIPKSRTGKAQMASVLKAISITRSGALRHGKEQDHILENMAKEISQGMSNILMHTFLSPTPASPAINTHKKVKAEEGSFRKKSNIIQLKPDDRKRLYTSSVNKWSISSNMSESRWQNEKEKEGNEVLFEAGLQFLNSTGSRKDRNMLITEQEVQQEMLVSENPLESICSPLMIPFQTQELKKNISPQKDILYRIGGKILCPKSGKATFDDLLTDETKCSTISDGNSTEKLDVHSAVSLQLEEEEENIKTQKGIKYIVDQSIPPTKSENSVLGGPCDENSRRKVGGHIAKKHKELQRDLLTMSMTSVLCESKRQEKLFKFPEGKALKSPKHVTMKAKKALCSQMLNITEHGNLYCRKEQECSLKSTIKDVQPNESVTNIFSSPIPISTDNKMNIEMHSTPKTEMDQPRVKMHKHTYLELEKSPCDGKAWKANMTYRQNRSSSTRKMNVQHEKEGKTIQKLLSGSVPHFSFNDHFMKNSVPCKSKSELNSSEGRRTWNLSCTAQKMRQEKHSRETDLDPLSRHMMNVLQVDTVKISPHTQEGTKCMVDLLTPFPKAGTSETGSVQCDSLWDGNPKSKYGSLISEKKAWNQNNLVRTVLKPLDFFSRVSSEPQSQNYTLEFVGKKSIMSTKHVTLKAKKLPISQLLNSTRCLKESQRKQKYKYKMKERPWNESTGEALLCATEGAKIPPPKSGIDEHSFFAAARGTLYNRTLHKNLDGHITEEKAKSGENLATTFLGPLDFFTAVLSDSESQINTVQLSEKKIILNPKCLTMEKKPPISQILKTNRQFTAEHRKNLGSNLENKMKEMRQGKNVVDTFPNTIYFTSDTSDIKRQSRFKTEIDRVSRLSLVQPTQMELPVEELMISESLNTVGHAALSIGKEQEEKTDVERDKTGLNADLKPKHASTPIPLHIKMEQSPSTWDIYEEYSEERNALNKAKFREKEECGPQVLFRTAPWYTQPFESGADQMKQQNTMLPLESCSNTVKYLNVSFPQGKESLDGAQVTDSLSNSSSPRLRGRKKVHVTCKTYQKVQKEVCLPRMFLHSLSICKPMLPESKTQKDSVEQGVKEGIICPQRRTLELKKSVCSKVFNTTDYGTPSNRGEWQQNIKQKTANVKYRKGKSDSVVANIYEFIPSSPHLKLNKETIDGIISNNLKRTKQHVSQMNEKDRIKGVNLKEIMNLNVVLKAEKSSPSYILDRKKCPMLSNIIKQESRVQIGNSKSGMKLTNKCTSLPSLSHPNLNSRIKVGKDKSGIPRSCLSSLKLQASSDVRKTSFAVSINGATLSNVIESKQHLPQKKEEDRENIVYVKDIMGLKCITLKGKRTPFKHILNGKEPQWNNKEEEKMMQEEKSDLDIVQNKPHASIPSLPPLEWGPGIKEEVYMRGITGFCLPSLTLQELSHAMGICEEPTDDILNSIKKAKYMPQKDDNRVEMALEEIRHPKRIASKVKQSPIAQELQLNIKEKEKKMQEDKDKQVESQSKSCAFISFLPYSEADTRTRREQVMLIKPRSSLLQSKLQESSDIGKIAYKKSIYGDISNSIKKDEEHIMQEEEERVKMAKVIALKKKKSPISQEIQLDIKEQEKKIQKINGEPSGVLTNTSTSIPAPSHLKLDTRIKKADSVTEVPRDSLPELSHQKSSDTVQKASKESTEGDITSDVQEGKENMPHKEEIKRSDEKEVMHPKDKDLKGKKVLSQDIPLNLKEQEKAGREGTGKQEAVLPTNQASESSLTHHELDTRIEGEEDIQGITKSAICHLQLQKSFDAEKIAYTTSIGDDISNDVKAVQEYEPQKREDRRKIVNMEYYILPCPHVLGTPGDCGPQIREVQTNEEELGHVQERKSEVDEVLTGPSVPQFKLNKGIEYKEEKQGVTRPFLPPSWQRESSDAEKLEYAGSPLNDMSSDSKRTKYVTQREDIANIFEKDIMHSKYVALKAKKSPLFHILNTNKLEVNIKEQVKGGQEATKETVVLQSKICPLATSSIPLKLDTIKEEEGESGVTNYMPHLEPQNSLPLGQIASTESIDSRVKKGKRHLLQKENDRGQTVAMNGCTHPNGTDFKAKTSPPLCVFGVAEHDALSKRREPEWSIKERVELEQGRKGGPDVALTKTPPPKPSPSHSRWDTRTKADKDLLASTRFSPSQLQLPESSGAGKIRHADSSGGIGLCDVIIKANQHVPYKEAKERVKTEGEKGKIFSKTITLRAETSPLTHLLSRKGPPSNIKEQGKEVQEGKGEPERRETYASLPPPSDRKWHIRMDEKEDTVGITKSYFPPLKIQNPSNSGKKAYNKLFDGHMLIKEDKLKTNVEDKMFPKCMDLKAKKLPLSYILDARKLKWKIEAQEDENKLVTNLKDICISLLTLPYLKFDITEGEGYMIRIKKLPLSQLQSKESSDAAKIAHEETTVGELSKDIKEFKEHVLQKEEKEREKNVDMNSIVDLSDMYLKGKKSPILFTYNLSDLQSKTKEQMEKVQEGKHEPDDVTLTETCASKSSPPHLNVNTTIEGGSVPILTGSSLSPVNLQELSDSEEVVCVEPITHAIFISPQESKQHVPQSKEDNGVEIVNLTFPKHQEKKTQESKDEPDVVLTKFSTSLPSLPHFKLSKEIQVDDEMLKSSVLQRMSNAGEVVPTESIRDDIMKDVQNEKQYKPQKEKKDREKTVDMRGAMHTTDITLKSKQSPPSRMLHRTELHLNIGGQEQKKCEGQGKPAGSLLRQIYVSKPLTNLTLDKGTQVDEKMLGIKRPSLLPLMLSALSDADKIAETKAIGGEVGRRKQSMSQKEKKYEVRTVDMRIRMHHKEARISPISRILNTKEFVVNIQEPKERVHEGKDESVQVLTRTFLSIPSAPPLFLDSSSEVDKGAPGITGSHPQQNLQESSHTRKAASREPVAGDGEILAEKAELPVPLEEAMQQWTSNFMISVQRRKEPPRVKSEGDLSQLLLNSQHEDIYFTGFGTMRSGKRLECFFTGREAQPENYKTETFTTFLSYPTMDPTKIENLKKETEIMDNLNRNMNPQGLVSLPRKISKEIHITFGTPVSSRGFPVSKREAHQPETLSKASLGSADPCKFDKPEKDVQNNDKMNKMFSSTVSAPQTKRSLEKMTIIESNNPQNIEEQEIVMKKQVVLWSQSGHKTRLNSSLSLKFPLQNGKQKTPLEIDVHKQTTVYPGTQILPGGHMDITEFDSIRGKKEQALLVPEQEGSILESLQKSLPPHWTVPIQSGNLEEKNETDTSTTINLEQKKLGMEEGKLKIDTNIAVHLEEDKIEMHRHTTVNLEKEKIKVGTSNTVNLKAPSLKTEESQTKTQAINLMANSCSLKQKHQKELKASGAKQNIQPQKLFQKHVLNSFYAYIPLSPKFDGRKGRLTIADLKRELSPIFSTMKIQNHPISQILGNTGRGTPSNRMKLEYDFNKPEKVISWGEDASGIFIRSLSISMMSPFQTEETVKSETNLKREKIICFSKFPEKSPNTCEVKRNSSNTAKNGDQNFTNTVPQDSQPFMVDEQQMQKLPSVKSEANFSCEINEKTLTPQMEERVVPEHGISKTIKEPDLLIVEQEEKAPKPIMTPTECPSMSEVPKENVETHMKSNISMNISPPGVEKPQCETQPFDTTECTWPPEHTNQSEPVRDTTTQKVQQQKTSPGTGPVPPQEKSNEIEIVADSASVESLLLLYKAIKNVFESQVKNWIQDKIYADMLEKVKAQKPDDWQSQPSVGGPDTTATEIHPKVQPKLILERLTPKETNKLTNHLESKALEIKLNLIPERAKQSFTKFNFYPKSAISEGNSSRLYPSHKKMCFLSLQGIDTIELNLKHKCQNDSPPISCRKTLIVNVSSGSEESIRKLKCIDKLESGTSLVTSANEVPLPHILQNYSVDEKDKLLIHFSKKTLEIQMKAFSRIVRESYEMADAQERRKPLCKCINSGVKIPKRRNRILLLFEEKSLHQIDLDLQYKYLRFLLGLRGKSMFPKPNALPKHTLKLNTVAMCKSGDDSRESGGLSIDTGSFEQHISFKMQSPHENSSLTRKFLKPTHVCSDPDQHGTVQKDTAVLSELKSRVTPEKDKQYHVWFQEINTYESFDLKTQKNAPSLVDSHSVQIPDYFTDSQTKIESSTNLNKCSPLELRDSEECIFLEANPYLSQESQKILLELQKGIPLKHLFKMKKIKTDLKPFYNEDSGSHYISGCRKHPSIVKPPNYKSHKSKKYRSSSKIQSPDCLCHSSLNAVEVPSVSPYISFSEEKFSWTTGSRTSYSFAPLTESNIKLHLAKSQGKPHRHPESKERKKTKFDLFRKNNIHWDCDYSCTQSKEKHTRKKKVYIYEPERSDYFPSKHKSTSKPHQEDINFHSERQQNQPFFYACTPADSLEIIPKTIRWNVPQKTLRKRNFRVPLVAKISSSCSIWSSSKKLLGSLLEPFNPVHPN